MDLDQQTDFLVWGQKTAVRLTVTALLCTTALGGLSSASAAVCEVNDVDNCLPAGPNPPLVIPDLVGGSWELPSAGSISGGAVGVEKLGDGFITFYNLGTISGSNAGIETDPNSDTLTIINSGTISSGFIGVRAGGQLDLINNAGAVISGTFGGVSTAITSNDSIYNAGTIGMAGSVISLALWAGNDTLTLDTGSVLIGDAVGGVGSDAIILNGSGSEDDLFDGWESLEMDGDIWTLSADLVLGGASQTTITNGTLYMNGMLTSTNITIAPGGALGGTGTIVGDVDNSGMLDTRGGDVNISGNLTFQPGSSLAVTLGGGTSTTVAVTGNTVILGGASVIVAGDLTQDTTSTILTSGGLVNGMFDSVYDEFGNQVFFQTETMPNEVTFMKIATVGVGQVVSQAAEGLQLDSHRGLLNTIHARIDHRYRESARRGKQKQFGYAELPAPSSGSLMAAQLDDQFSALWPTTTNGGLQSGNHTPEFINTMMEENYTDAQRMRRSMSAVPRLQISTNYGGMWLEGFGVTSTQDADIGVTGYQANAGGFSVGLDSKAADNWIFGGMIGYSVSDAKLNGDAGQIDGRTVYTGIYMSNISTTHYANLFLTAAVTNFDAERAVTDGLTSGLADDEYGSYMWDARLELGRTFGFLEDDFIRPNIAVEYTSVFQDDYMDDGDGIVPGLLIEDHTTQLVRVEGQVDMLFGSQSFDDDGWSGRIFVGVAHEIFLDDREAEAFLDGFRDPVILSAGEDNRTFGMIGGSISFAVNQRLRTQLSYQGESNTTFERHNFVAGFSVAW